MSQLLLDSWEASEILKLLHERESFVDRRWQNSETNEHGDQRVDSLKRLRKLIRKICKVV